jgi:hypothetical protein
MMHKEINKKVGWQLSILAAFLLAISPIYADDTAYFGSGNTVIPVNNDQIQMVSEVVRIRYDNKTLRFYVNCEFIFKNAGDTTTVLMGFPETLMVPMEGAAETQGVPIANFKTFIGNDEIKTTYKKVNLKSEKSIKASEEQAYVWPIRFQKSETIVVKNSYDAGTGLTSTDGIFGFTYVVRTGARWKGNIERAEFYVDLSDAPHSPFFSISPTPQSVKNGIYFLKFDNLKPDFDIAIKGSHISAQLKYERNTVLEIMGGLVGVQLDVEKDDQFSFSAAKLEDYLRKKKLDSYSASLLRNLVFALHGRYFETPWVREYFAKQSWYIVNRDYSDGLLSEDEKLFASTVKHYEFSLK